MTGNRSFHRDVDALVASVVHMAELSRRSVHEGVDAFVQQDTQKAKAVVELNRQIDALDVEIEGRSLGLIALHQPMAIDLRILGASLKIITYLDRIGRYGYDCAKAALNTPPGKHVKAPVGVGVMRDKALGLLEMSMKSFQARDPELARKVEPADDEVDALYDHIVRECLTNMLEDPRAVSLFTNYILVARHIERVADNAAKIAEKTIYICTGKNRLETPRAG